MEKILLLIDGEAKCTLAELITINAEPDTTPIPASDVEQIEKLSIGEHLHVGLTRIERIEEGRI